MPPTDTSHPHPPSAPDPPAHLGGDGEVLHAYLAAFLSPAAAGEVLREVQPGRTGGASDDTAMLRQAREVLLRRVDVPLDLEVTVLVEDLGLALATVADVLGLPADTVETIVAREGLRGPAPLTSVDAPESGGDRGGAQITSDLESRGADRPTGVGRASGRRSRAGLRLAIALVAVIGLAAVVGVLALGDDSGGGEPGSCEPSEQQPICVADARVTDVVDRSGSPGAARDAFAPGETVKLWFAFEQLDMAQPALATYVWYREGAPLYADDFQLPPGGRANVTLAQTFATQPGAYAVQIRLGDDVLVERSFSIG